jgi:hypothetical protein
MKLLLFSGRIKLKKIPGKGGWTYAPLPAYVGRGDGPFRWMLVDVIIDDIEFNNLRTMPMGNGKMFLPVRAEIRKRIAKEAGATINLKVFASPKAIQVKS